MSLVLPEKLQQRHSCLPKNYSNVTHASRKSTAMSLVPPEKLQQHHSCFSKKNTATSLVPREKLQQRHSCLPKNYSNITRASRKTRVPWKWNLYGRPRLDGSFGPVVARNSEVLGSNTGLWDVWHRGCAYTMLQTVQRPRVSSVHGIVHYEYPLQSLNKSRA